jgi:hypothetical protein
MALTLQIVRHFRQISSLFYNFESNGHPDAADSDAKPVKKTESTMEREETEFCTYTDADSTGLHTN